MFIFWPKGSGAKAAEKWLRLSAKHTSLPPKHHVPGICKQIREKHFYLEPHILYYTSLLPNTKPSKTWVFTFSKQCFENHWVLQIHSNYLVFHLWWQTTATEMERTHPNLKPWNQSIYAYILRASGWVDIKGGISEINYRANTKYISYSLWFPWSFY